MNRKRDGIKKDCFVLYLPLRLNSNQIYPFALHQKSAISSHPAGKKATKAKSKGNAK
jgi:hypothetical protein